MGTPAGFSGAGAYEVIDALRLQLRLVRQRPRDVGPARLGDQRVPGGRVGTRQPRAVLPLGLGRLGAGRQGPRRASCRAAEAAEAAGSRRRASCRGTCRSAAPSAAIWIAMFAQRHFHEYGTTKRAAGVDRAERAPQRGAQPEGDLPRPDVDRRLHERARMITTPFCLYDCDVPCDGATAVIVSRRERAHVTCGTRRCASRRSARGSPAVRRGTSSTTSRPCRTATRARSCGRAPTSSPPTCRWRSSTTGSRGSRCRGWKRCSCAASARAARSSKAASASRATASCRSTRTAASSRRAGCTATASCTKARRRCGAQAGDRQIATPARGRRHRRRRRQHLRLPPPRRE